MVKTNLTLKYPNALFKGIGTQFVVRSVSNAPYLGDEFNDVGTNKHLVEERVKKGKACIVSAISMCNEVTMGIYAVQTLLLLYSGLLFLQVLLYNSRSWCNLSKQDLNSLRIIQMKYLKRIFHAPSSTSNVIVLLETGTLPIEQEIHKRQLNFLHHILTLENTDPVKLTYQEQLKYPYEKNWGNEIKELRINYGIIDSDEEITHYSKDSWKTKVKTLLKQA